MKDATTKESATGSEESENSQPIPVPDPEIESNLENTQPETETKLRDFLLEGLSSSHPAIPGKRTFHLHVLMSTERRCSTLFPYASGRRRPKVKVLAKDIVVILSEGKEKVEEEGKGRDRVMICGIEAALYRIPQTTSGILYVSKVDSTGYGTKPNVTGVLVRRLISYFIDEWMDGDRVRYLWVQLFARAQGEYLFLGSKSWKGKRILGDVGLCGWWKRCLGDIKGQEGEVRMRRWYLMAGLSETEAEEALGAGEGGNKGVWEYGHPYGQKEVPLPCPEGEEGEGYLGRIIPNFEDDPKSRFLEELGNDEVVRMRSPERKRARIEKEGEGEKRKGGEMGKVGVEEFWERMGFRQECVSGAVTGFYTVLAWRGTKRVRKGNIVGEVREKTVERILGLLKSGLIEFSCEEKAKKATLIVENTIRGLCESVYDEHVYGGVSINNPVKIDLNLKITSTGELSHVTKLVPRRKK